jgi:hypothetical protein
VHQRRANSLERKDFSERGLEMGHYYDVIVNHLKEHRNDLIDGDAVEIGALFGEGTKVLSSYLSGTPEKTLYVLDVFNLEFDETATENGLVMSELYKQWLVQRKYKSQIHVYAANTKGLKNVKTLAGDTKNTVIPSEKLSFSFIDGNHSPEYVENDFNLVWDKTSPGGIVGFHDYRGDLPEVTRKINELIASRSGEISDVYEPGKFWLCFVHKR